MADWQIGEFKQLPQSWSSWIPQEWLGLFKALSRNDQTICMANQWLKEHTESKYGDSLSWNKLCTTLLIKEPRVQDSKLLFLPRILLFPVHVQRLLLEIFNEYKHKIPQECLNSIVEYFEDIDDKWIKCLIDQIKRSTFLHDNGTPHRFSEKNLALYGNLITCLQNDEANDLNKLCFQVFDRSKKQTQIRDSHEDPFLSQPQAIDVDTPSSSLFSTSQTPMNPLKHLEHTPTSSNKRLSTHTFTQQKMDVSYEQSEATSQDMLIDSLDTTSTQLTFTEDMTKSVHQLYYIWQSGEENTELPTEIEIFTKITLVQMEHLCSSLDLSGLSEAGLHLACMHMATLSAHLPHSHAVCFAKTTLLPKVLCLDQSCSRILLLAFVTFSKHYGRAVVEGVLIPTVNNSSFDTSKADLMNKVIKDGLDQTLKVQLLKQAAEVDVEWNDAMLSVFQTLLDSKLQLGESCLLSLIQGLESKAAAHSKNLKFGKLLLAIITKYQQQILPSHLAPLQSIVCSHGSFLKKSLAAALKKL